MAMVILAFFILYLLPFAPAQMQSCGNSGNYTSNSTYEDNLRLLSSTLPKKAASNITLFATDTVGDAPDTIFALTLCRGDMNASACEGCVATAFEDGPRLCPYYKDVTLFYDACLLRFSNKNIVTTTGDDYITDNNGFFLVNNKNFTTSIDSTRRLLFTLINNTAQSAANNTRRFTTSRLDVSAFPTMYCLMQCRPDLTTDTCAACFQLVLQNTLRSVDFKQGAQVLSTRCTMRYEIYPFFFGDPMLRIMNLATEVPAINNTTPTQNPAVQSRGSWEKKPWPWRALSPPLAHAPPLSLVWFLSAGAAPLRWSRSRPHAHLPPAAAFPWLLVLLWSAGAVHGCSHSLPRRHLAVELTVNARRCCDRIPTLRQAAAICAARGNFAATGGIEKLRVPAGKVAARVAASALRPSCNPQPPELLATAAGAASAYRWCCMRRRRSRKGCHRSFKRPLPVLQGVTARAARSCRRSYQQRGMLLQAAEGGVAAGGGRRTVTGARLLVLAPCCKH
ncbi:hypothetical protein QYE76_037541 [Lolium multiflorum]|uniref:Gnk2-homologous domain-containing protein n=1 Tax=Lolium multiflorum TaxID=4521 RepID=A0AAD8QH72_LOLMU|nr:hypothetical protein QYE76_037541 [Lolium multiflorum]